MFFSLLFFLFIFEKFSLTNQTVLKEHKLFRPYLTSDSVLSEYLTKLCEEYKVKIKNRLLQYQEVLIQHTIFALKKIDKGTKKSSIHLIVQLFMIIYSNNCAITQQGSCVLMFTKSLRTLQLRL